MLIQPILGAIINEKYEDLEEIGSGGFATVYKAHQPALNRIVVIKIYDAQLASTAEIKNRIRREAKAASAIKHRNVPAVFDHGFLDDGRPYLVFEYIEGQTLAAHIKEQTHLPTDEVISIFRNLCEALSAAHHADVIHRDVTPNNVMLVKTSDTTFPTAKLIDFGLVRPSGAWAQNTVQLTQFGQTVGSPRYMSPEQCTGKDVDARSDIYSLACCMYEAWTGSPAIPGNSALEIMHAQLFNQPTPPVVDDTNTVEKTLRNIIMRCLEKDPSGRCQSCDLLLDDLQFSNDVHWEPAPNSIPNPHAIAAAKAQNTKAVSRMGTHFNVKLSRRTSIFAGVVWALLIALAAIGRSLALSWWDNALGITHVASTEPAESSQLPLQLSASSAYLPGSPIDLSQAKFAPLVDAPECWILAAHGAKGEDCILVKLKQRQCTAMKHLGFLQGPFSIACDRSGVVRLGYDYCYEVFDKSMKAKRVPVTCGGQLIHFRSDGVAFAGMAFASNGASIRAPSSIYALNTKDIQSVSIVTEPGFTFGGDFCFDSSGVPVIAAQREEWARLRNYAYNFRLYRQTASGWQPFFSAKIPPRSWDLDNDNHVVFISEDGIIGRFNGHTLERFARPEGLIPENIAVRRN